MGAVKQAIIEVDDAVCGCLNAGRTLNQTIRDLRSEFNKRGKDNPYMLYEVAIEIANKISKLNEQLKEAEQNDGCSKTSNNGS